MFTQTLLERFNKVYRCGRSGSCKKPYPGDFRGLLRLGEDCNSKQHHYKQIDKKPTFFIAHTSCYVSRER